MEAILSVSLQLQERGQCDFGPRGDLERHVLEKSWLLVRGPTLDVSIEFAYGHRARVSMATCLLVTVRSVLSPGYMI